MTKRYKGVNWPGALFLTLSPIAALVLSIYHVYTEGFIWQIWALAALFYALTVGSITGGYHRYFAHKTYEAHAWVKWFWALFGGAAWQNSILIWARDHRVHHRFVDTDNDPYSIKRGFFFAHFGWMLIKEEPGVKLEAYGRDLEKDPVVAFQHKYYVPLAIAVSFGLPTLIGYFMGSPLGGLAIAGFLRVVVVHHVTFMINSWCHYFGKQRYTDTNTARDSFLMAILAFGEGYHNYHHLFANDYRNGVRWYHLDATKWIIRTLSLVGAVHSLRRTPRTEIIKAQLQMDELRLKSCLEHNWQAQLQTQLDNLKLKVEAAYARFEQLREEYKRIASDYTRSSMERLHELKFQLRMARIEFRAALKQWREFNSFVLQTASA